MAKTIDFSKVYVDAGKITDRKDWVRYLVLVNWHMKEQSKLLKAPNDKRFQKFVAKQLDSYLSGKEPPATIAGAIMNIADQHLSGDAVTLRAGDYIALQSQYRKMRR